jgi:predicted glycosyltransferase involved in capsule biosynthesis
MTPEQFWRLNGYSNHFWGWGAEDDDIAYRSVNSTIYDYINIVPLPVNKDTFRILRGPNYKHIDVVGEEYGKFSDLGLAKKSFDATNPHYK